MGFLKRFLGGASEPGPPVDVDAQVIEALRRSGADLAQPREVIHYLYFGTEPATHAAVVRLDRDGRFVHAVIDPDTGKSSVKVTHTAVVTLDAIHALRAEFEAAAAEGGGEYDGWEAAAGP